MQECISYVHTYADFGRKEIEGKVKPEKCTSYAVTYAQLNKI